MDFSSNYLSSTISAELPCGIFMLSLDSNRISGTLPSGSRNNARSRNFTLWRESQIPLSLGVFQSCPIFGNTWATVSVLNLGTNRLSGSIPFGGNCTKMVDVNKQWNILDNPVVESSEPQCMKHRPLLAQLNLANNSLSGSVSIGNQTVVFPNLRSLDLGSNSLSGQLPTEIAFLSNLNTLLLNTNSFSGSISPSMSMLTNLRFFSLSENRLSGSSAPEFRQWRQMNALSLFQNRFLDLSSCNGIAGFIQDGIPVCPI